MKAPETSSQLSFDQIEANLRRFEEVARRHGPTVAQFAAGMVALRAARARQTNETGETAAAP